MNWQEFLVERKEQLITISAIFIVSVISFGTFNSTILSSDDWSYFVAKFVFGNLKPINLTDRRPLILALYYGLASIFGLQLRFYYFFNFLIIFFSALIVYVIVKRVFPEQNWIASLVALVYLIYPVDYTRTWLIMIYIRFWWLVSLGTIWLLLEFRDSGKLWVYALAMLGIAIPLGAYEGQFGIILLASTMITFFSHGVPVKTRFAILAGAMGIGVVFLLWRTFLQANIFEIKDAYIGALQFNPVILIERYFYGFYIFFIGWLNPIQTQLKLIEINLFAWAMVYALICGALFFFLTTKALPAARIEPRQRIESIKTYLMIFLIGFALWVAGYIPIITLYKPVLALISSRVNSFAIPGASLMLVSAIAIPATFISNSTRLKRLLVILMVLPFIVAGVFVQHQVHRENQIAWETQKKIWNGVFETIPNVQDKKTIVIIIPDYRQLRPFESYPFLAPWEIDAGAQVLYNNPTISANYFYKDFQPAELFFTKNGFKPIPTDKIIPYKRLVFVYYDPKSDSVTLVEKLENILALPFTINNYAPRENIVSEKQSTADFRWLVR